VPAAAPAGKAASISEIGRRRDPVLAPVPADQAARQHAAFVDVVARGFDAGVRYGESLDRT
jgi:hypothetical protein